MAKNVPCILVVEDDRAVRDLIVAFLKKGGHTNIVTAGNAEEALFYLLRDAGLDIRLAIVDLVLPNASGLALIRKLRNAKSARRRATPVIVLTSRTDTNTYKMAARRGIQGYLMKPVSASLFLQTVADVLMGRKPSSAADAPAVQVNQALNDVPPPPTLDT
ncbi:MAG: response regulator [Rhodospirillaceae bacterium]